MLGASPLASWGTLGRSWGDPGAVLGRSWDDPGTSNTNPGSLKPDSRDPETETGNLETEKRVHRIQHGTLETGLHRILRSLLAGPADLPALTCSKNPEVFVFMISRVSQDVAIGYQWPDEWHHSRDDWHHSVN